MQFGQYCVKMKFYFPYQMPALSTVRAFIKDFKIKNKMKRGWEYSSMGLILNSTSQTHSHLALQMLPLPTPHQNQLRQSLHPPPLLLLRFQTLRWVWVPGCWVEAREPTKGKHGPLSKTESKLGTN